MLGPAEQPFQDSIQKLRTSSILGFRKPHISGLQPSISENISGYPGTADPTTNNNELQQILPLADYTSFYKNRQCGEACIVVRPTTTAAFRRQGEYTTNVFSAAAAVADRWRAFQSGRLGGLHSPEAAERALLCAAVAISTLP
jgi:hypothetical protein